MTTTTTTTTTIGTRRSNTRHHTLRAAALTTGAALAANLAVFGVARARNVSFQFPRPGSAGTQSVTAGAVAAVTVMTMILGWALAARAASHHRSLRTMAIIGAVLAVMSIVAPLTTDADLSVKVTLASLHVITGGLYVVGVAWLHRTNQGAVR